MPKHIVAKHTCFSQPQVVKLSTWTVRPSPGMNSYQLSTLNIWWAYLMHGALHAPPHFKQGCHLSLLI